MIRLNLGCGPHLLRGFANLDAEMGWRFEDGIPYDDETVDGITISHALMYVPLADWPAVFADFARVLATAGVIRITEDATDDRRSERFGGHPEAVTLTTPTLVCDQLEVAGLTAVIPGERETLRPELDLRQNWHGGEPKCFFVEGQKP